MKQLTLLSLLICLHFGCTREPRTEASYLPDITDSDLEKEVLAKINSDPQLNAARLSVSANAERSMVRLTGRVESEAQRVKAMGLARSARADITVDNRIEVGSREESQSDYTEKPAVDEGEKPDRETTGEYVDDEWIQSEIRSKLIGDDDMAERKIRVDVKSHVVTLRGTVESEAEKSKAGRIAKKTDGVRRVINQVKVRRPL